MSELAQAILDAVEMSPSMATALAAFDRGVRDVYSRRLVGLVLFGSRARGDAHEDSDLDVAVVLDVIEDRWAERERLWDISYRTLTGTDFEVHAWPLSQSEWSDPDLHSNPALVWAMREEGTPVATPTEVERIVQGASS